MSGKVNISVVVRTYAQRAAELLESSLRAAGCSPEASEIEWAVLRDGCENCLSCRIPADGEPFTKEGLGYEVGEPEGMALENITDVVLQKAVSTMIPFIIEKTKTPVFAKLYTPKAVAAVAECTTRSVRLRLIRAYDPVRDVFITRLDCGFGHA